MRVRGLTSTLAALVALASAATPPPSTTQLSDFSYSTKVPIGILTTSSGCPLQQRAAYSSLNTKLLRNEFFMDSMTHLLHERTIPRVVHAKGTGAFGYFEVTNDATDLTKAKFLDQVGKRTRVAIRFSQPAHDKGQSDLSYIIYGYAIKFYTEDGNFDIPALSNSVFSTREPIEFFSLTRTFRPNPVTNLPDQNPFWDYLTSRPEGLGVVIRAFSPLGLPASYRNLLGHSIHAMQLANSNNDTTFSRFYFTPDLGVQSMVVGSTTDPDYYRRDLYDNIANGTFPSWTVWLQPFTLADVENATKNGVDMFDITREISQTDFPLRQIGKVVLNENPKNYFADIEQLAYCPGNLVPGIVGGPDQLFEARVLAYRAAHIHRLGINFNKIPVNQPLGKVNTYNRDGAPPTGDNEGGAPNYFPNSFGGAVPVRTHQPDIVQITERKSSNIDQVGDFYRGLPEAGKVVTAANFAVSLTGVADSMIVKALDLLTMADADLGARTSTNLQAANATSAAAAA